MDNGTLLAWPTAVWGPGVLSGSAPKTAGDWEDGASCPPGRRVTPTPASGAARRQRSSSKSKNQAAAVQFASWLNTDPTRSRP